MNNACKEGKIWTKKEDKRLLEIVKNKGDMTWKEIAQELAEDSKTTKSGKQCRERYRNYLNPELREASWQPHEKILFILLHRKYGNQWTLIAKKLKGKSDLVIKNYYYALMRKALRCYKMGKKSYCTVQKPGKLYKLIYALKTLRRSYLPVLHKQEKTRSQRKEKVILNLLEELGATDLSLRQCEEDAIKAFRDHHSWAKMPLTIEIDLEKLGLSKEIGDDIVQDEKDINQEDISKLVLIKYKTTLLAPPSTTVNAQIIVNQQAGILGSPTISFPYCPFPSYWRPFPPTFYPFPQVRHYPPIRYQSTYNPYFVDPKRILEPPIRQKRE